MNKKLLHSQKGITLVEVLLAVVIASLIVGIAYAILFQGLDTYHRVTQETKLRDEADIIMTNFIQVLYPLKLSDIKEIHFNESSSNNYYFTTNDDKKTGFIDGKVVVNDRELTLAEDIELSVGKAKITEMDKALYEIHIALETTGKFPRSLDVKSEILLVDDIGEGS